MWDALSHPIHFLFLETLYHAKHLDYQGPRTKSMLWLFLCSSDFLYRLVREQYQCETAHFTILQRRMNHVPLQLVLRVPGSIFRTWLRMLEPKEAMASSMWLRFCFTKSAVCLASQFLFFQPHLNHWKTYLYTTHQQQAWNTCSQMGQKHLVYSLHNHWKSLSSQQTSIQMMDPSPFFQFPCGGWVRLWSCDWCIVIPEARGISQTYRHGKLVSKWNTQNVHGILFSRTCQHGQIDLSNVASQVFLGWANNDTLSCRGNDVKRNIAKMSIQTTTEDLMV